MAAIVHAEPQLFDLWRHCRIKSQHLSAGAHTGQAAQHKIYRDASADHRTPGLSGGTRSTLGVC